MRYLRYLFSWSIILFSWSVIHQIDKVGQKCRALPNGSLQESPLIIGDTDPVIVTL